MTSDWPRAEQAKYKRTPRVGALVDFDPIEKVLRSYFVDDFPKRVLDALVFGGILAGGWTLVAGRGRRKMLRAFLKTHNEFVERFKRVVDRIGEKENAKTFKETTRRQLLDTHGLLKGQQLHLFARLGEADQKTLLDYFERIARVMKVVDFNVPSAWVDDGLPLDYETLNPFKGRIAELFKPNPDDGVATTTPMEEACDQLKTIVWSVYLLPILRHPKLRMNDARAIDAALREFSTKFGGSSMSAEPKDWSDPR